MFVPRFEHNTIVGVDDAAACLHVILPGLKGGSEFITCANFKLPSSISNTSIARIVNAVQSLDSLLSGNNSHGLIGCFTKTTFS